MGSTFGHLFRITTFGESHGGAVGVVVDGCPPRVALSAEAVQVELDRRRPGTSMLASQRQEADRVRIASGVEGGLTLGSPIALWVENTDAKPGAYDELRHVYRPSHADFTTDARYGIRSASGGGRASARETVGRVAGGAVARAVLASLGRVEIVAWVDEVAGDRASVDPDGVSRDAVEAHDVRCPDPEAAERFEARILEARKAGDTVGGVVRCIARGVPAGLGDPVFDKLDADLAKAMLSLPAAKGFEVGSGYAGTTLTGLQHNDAFVPDPARGVGTRTNRSGGIQGGLSNGMPIELSVAFKPVATVFHEQDTVDDAGRATTIRPRGRHDPCVLPRAVPIVEAMVALVLADHWLRFRGQIGEPPPIPLRS
ncbi:MAG: chorismate synthase [Myxococcales bacterium]|nr:chorismate synthase [Myxococcales bacterium]